MTRPFAADQSLMTWTRWSRSRGESADGMDDTMAGLVGVGIGGVQEDGESMARSPFNEEEMVGNEMDMDGGGRYVCKSDYMH